MNDMFEEFKRAADAPGGQVGDALRRADAGVTAASIVKGRRRRVATEGAVAAVAIGAVAMAGWGLTAVTHGAASPATMPTFHEGGEVTVYPQLFDGALCNQVEGGPGAYVPFGEQGVHLAGPAAEDLNLEVTGTLVSVDGTGTATALGRGEHEFSSPNGDHATMPSVQFYATWDGDARLSIRTAGYLVVDGWTVTLPWQSNTDLFSAQSWIDNPVPAYDAQTDRSTIAASNVLDTFCLANIYDENWESFVYPGGPAEVHTVVQVQDENGVVIAQYFDALDADGSVVTFNGLKDQYGAVSLPKVTDADVQRTITARAAAAHIQAPGVADGAVTVGSAANSIDGDLASQGVPLEQAQAGYRTRTSCTVRSADLAANGDSLSVVPGDMSQPPVPTTWPAAAFEGEYGTIPLDPNAIATFSENAWYIGHEVQVFFADPSDASLIRGQVTGGFAWSEDSGAQAMDPTKGVFVFPVESPCDDTAGLTPGTYRAIIAVDGAPDGIRALYGTDEQIAETWFDAGTITITD